MLFKQLLDEKSCTYTYLISCPDTGETALIDPVLDSVERDLQLLQSLGLNLSYTIETHVHADHVTSAQKLKQLCKSKIVYPEMNGLPCADFKVREGEAMRVGNLVLHPLFTPGHTDHHHAYLIDTPARKLLFTGDALLIESCGRTDFQCGDAETLYKSIHSKFFSLPDETLVYPCHDYEGRFVSSIGQEKVRNPRLGGGKTLAEFVEIMNGLELDDPQQMQFAVPSNMQCGECTVNAPETLKSICHSRKTA